MAHCEACRVLEHAPADDDPPAALGVNLVMDRLYGALFSYKWTVCNSTWIRFRANHLYNGRSPSRQAMT